jgi:hypothetical protein
MGKPATLFLLISLLSVCGCTQTDKVLQSPPGISPTREGTVVTMQQPFSTSTAAGEHVAITTNPTPHIDLVHGIREWVPASILVQAGLIHDEKRDPFDQDPTFVLYADGTLIQKGCAAASCDYTIVQLNTKQICSLLNTIELVGFFDYDPSSYRTPLAGGEITYLEVSAWREQRIALYQLTDWLEDPNWLGRLLDCDGCREPPEIKPALSETYWLLDGFSVPGAVTYHPSSLAVWLSAPELAGEPVDWTLGALTLSRLAGMTQCPNAGQQQAVMLSGSEAENLASYINQITNQGLSPIFSEGSLVYQVTTRWLLPYEQAAGCGESTNQFPSMDIPIIDTPMICHVNDGIIPTATPTLFP